MMKPPARILKKVVEFLGCVACLITKFLTDIEARRVFITRQKYSREWSLLNNIFWNAQGDAYAWITYGGYSIITLLFAISICIDSKSRPSVAEKIFLVIGSLMFFGVGGLVFASIDQVPDELIDNAIVLGCLSFFVAFLFLIDVSEKMDKRRTDATQTDTSSIDRHFSKIQLGSTVSTVNSQINLIDSDRHDGRFQSEHKIGNGQSQNHMQSIQQMTTQPLMPQQQQNNSNMTNNHQQQHYQQQHHINQEPQIFNGYQQDYHQNSSFVNHHDIPSSTQNPFITEDVVQTQTLPSPQMPVFSKVKQPPTILNHFETEPYKKILSRSNQSAPASYSRFHDPPQYHNENPTFYDDFSNIRKQQTYYQGPKVDQGKLVIRDYSLPQSPQQQRQTTCNCPSHPTHDDTEHDDSATIKSGYVSEVAKLWDNRAKTTTQDPPKQQSKDFRGLNTVV